MATKKEIDEFFKKLEDTVDEYFRLKKAKPDYNIFLALHKSNNEVNLHSRFIYSLINPQGYHYKKEKFLEKFLEICGLKNFINIKKAEVHREYGIKNNKGNKSRIDLLIKDDKKCIIIENKIWAKDQYAQLTNYAKNIKIPKENIYLIYLNPLGIGLSKKGLGSYRIENGYLIYGKERKVKYKYKEITYKEHIKKWLNEIESLESDKNIKFLIQQYKDITNHLTGDYISKKDKVVQKFMEDNYKKVLEYYPKCKNDETREETLKRAMVGMVNNFIKNINLNHDELEIDDCWLGKDNSRTLFEIYSPDWEDEENPEKEEFILFSVFIYDDKFYIEIAPHRNMKTVKGGWAKLWKDYCDNNDIVLNEDSRTKSTLYAKEIEVGNNLNLKTVDGLTKAIKEYGKDIKKGIKSFIHKYAELITEINNKKTKKAKSFWALHNDKKVE